MCGQIQGIATAIHPKTGTRVICYCDDCQSFAHYLGRGQDILNQWGGTDIYQLAPSQITITQGQEHLQSLRLRPKGLLRWYAACCQTPLANTVSAAFPLIGLIHGFIPATPERESALGPVMAIAHKQYATSRIPASHLPPLSARRYLVKIMMKMTLWKLSGKGRPSPFFDHSGQPIVAPEIVVKEGE
jgi:hypothetical protein